MKIVFIPNLPYTYRDHQRFGVEYFLTKGYDIEVMDVHKILIHGYKEKVKIEYFTFNKHWEPENKEEIIDRVKKLTKSDYIFYFIGGFNVLNLLREMQQNTEAKFITYIGGAIPTTIVRCTLIDFLKKNIKDILKSIIPKYRLKFDTDFYVSGSPKDEISFSYLITEKTKIIKANSRDYNLCLKSKPYKNNRKYCVFLDTDVIDASDYILFGNNVKNDVESYLKKLINFLHWIEKEYNLEVIIAAHPKSRVYKDKENIEGFKVVHGKSVELVQGSEFVLNEGTTAISYAIFFNKPLIFFTFKEISFFYHHVCSFAKELKKDIINIDLIEKNKFDIELKNMKRYQYYKKNYLTYNNSHLDSYEIIEEKIFNNARG